VSDRIVLPLINQLVKTKLKQPPGGSQQDRVEKRVAKEANFFLRQLRNLQKFSRCPENYQELKIQNFFVKTINFSYLTVSFKTTYKRSRLRAIAG